MISHPAKRSLSRFMERRGRPVLIALDHTISTTYESTYCLTARALMPGKFRREQRQMTIASGSPRPRTRLVNKLAGGAIVFERGEPNSRRSTFSHGARAGVVVEIGRDISRIGRIYLDTKR